MPGRYRAGSASAVAAVFCECVLIEGDAEARAGWWEDVPIGDGQLFADDIPAVIDAAVHVAGVAQVGHGKGEMGLGRGADPQLGHAADDTRQARRLGNGEDARGRTQAAGFRHVHVEDIDGLVADAVEGVGWPSKRSRRP